MPTRKLALVTLALLLSSAALVASALDCNANVTRDATSSQTSSLSHEPNGEAELAPGSGRLLVWRVVAPVAIVRASFHTTSDVIGQLQRDQIAVTEGAVRLSATTLRLHVVAPLDGWVSESTSEAVHLAKHPYLAAYKRRVMHSATVTLTQGEVGHLCVIVANSSKLSASTMVRVVKPLVGNVAASAFLLGSGSSAAGGRSLSSAHQSCTFRLGDRIPHHSWARYAPSELLLAQSLWNAAQVGFLFVFSCLVAAHRDHCCVGWFWCSSILVLPFSVYVTSPPARAFGAIALVSTLWLACSDPVVRVRIMVTPARPGVSSAAFRVGTFEFLAFLCNLLCSLYNFRAEARLHLWPEWSKVYHDVGHSIGMDADPNEFLRAMYVMGLSPRSAPAFIPLAGAVGHLSNVGTPHCLVFLLVWSVLPFLYVAYFGLMFWIAGTSQMSRPSMIVQRTLCLWGVVHFLFLTDGVDYRFGRGMLNSHAEWFHWSERWCWRIAILLPLYQKVVTGHWRHHHGKRQELGLVIHYVVACWATSWFVFHVLLADTGHFWQFATSQKQTNLPAHNCLATLAPLWFCYYYKALLLMTFFYGLLLIVMPGQKISILTT